MQNKLLENGSKYEKYDTNNDGVVSDEEMKDNGWEPQPLKILRQDMSTYMESDIDLSSLKTRMSIQETKTDMLESIIKSIVNRGFLIKNSIEWAKFQQGL